MNFRFLRPLSHTKPDHFTTLFWDPNKQVSQTFAYLHTSCVVHTFNDVGNSCFDILEQTPPPNLICWTLVATTDLCIHMFSLTAIMISKFNEFCICCDFFKAINYIFLDFLLEYAEKRHSLNDTIPHHFYNDSCSKTSATVQCSDCVPCLWFIISTYYIVMLSFKIWMICNIDHGIF